MSNNSSAIEFTHVFFDNCQKAVDKAIIYNLTVAEFNIKLHLFDPEAKFSLKALTHLLSPYDGYAEYSIYLIDGARHQTLLAPRFWDIEDIEPDQSIKGFTENNLYASLDTGNGTFLLVDNTAKRAIQVFGLENALLPHWECFHPLRKIFSQFTYNTDYVLVHAGGLGTVNGDDGILITGKGRAGKSTICGLSVGNNVAYVGDDFILIDTKLGYAYCLYTSLKVRKHLAAVFESHSIFKRYPDTANLISEELEHGRVSLFMPAENFHFLKLKIKIRAILTPIYEPDIPHAYLIPILAPVMIRNMAQSTLLMVKGDDKDNQNSFLKMGRIVKEIPGYEFYYNADSGQIKNVVNSIIHQTASAV